ncbi:hypothetical protein [Edaphobacter bradus]|uniref:hypothetical protein n=1 Tax=Edaphobacter bradus TaxID=2259016 RepID=UPI0021DF5BD5|nr:hypothetical protein [Edaphobacter bradus]
MAEHIHRWQRETPYGASADWVFASFKLKGKQPRAATMIVADYLRPAAVKAGAASSFTPFATRSQHFS